MTFARARQRVGTLLGLWTAAALGLAASEAQAGPEAAPSAASGFASAVLAAGASFVAPACGEYFVRFEGTVSRTGWTKQVVRADDGDWIKFVKTVDTRVYGARTEWSDIVVGDRVTICYRAYETAHQAGAFRSPDRRAGQVYVTESAP